MKKLNKRLIKILVAIAFISAVAIISNKVSASTTFDKISLDIYVESNGDANITETWKVDADSGTELYHPYYNLGNSQIKDLTVSYKGIKYETLSEWNVKASRSKKAYKCGLNPVSNGVEICWGLNELGDNNIYTVNYTITNFVSQLEDNQMIYWTLIPYDFSNEIDEAEITIHSNVYFANTIDVWGYGKKGAPCYVENGKIHMIAKDIESNEYMTILAKFPNGTFSNVENEIPGNFQHYLDMAEKDAVHYKELDREETIKAIVGAIIFVIFPIVAFIFVVGVASLKEFSYGEYGRKVDKKGEYFRDIPLGGDIFKAFYVGTKYGICTKLDGKIAGALFLKWIKEKKIILNKNEKGGWFGKDEFSFTLSYTGTFENHLEGDFYEMVRKASKDGILEKNEFKKWCTSHYTEIDKWLRNIDKETLEALKQEGLVVEKEKKFLCFKGKAPTVTQSLYEEATHLAGLKRYLKEYTLIKERQAPEVELFESYLIFAQLFGISDEVTKQFSELYPDLIDKTSFNSYNYLLYSNMYSKSFATAYSRAIASARAYSGGGGGFSSGGGGGGSFGGGGGGGGCR